MTTDISTVPDNETVEEAHAVGVMLVAALLDRMRQGNARPDDLYRTLCMPGAGSAPLRLQGLCFALQEALRQYAVLATAAAQEASDATHKHMVDWFAQLLPEVAKQVAGKTVRLPPPPAPPRQVDFTYDASGEIVGATLH